MPFFSQFFAPSERIFLVCYEVLNGQVLHKGFRSFRLTGKLNEAAIEGIQEEVAELRRQAGQPVLKNDIIITNLIELEA